ncbi:MAG TPA: ABC transporter ATP-binding protein [Rikenellaceae bacterium]|nr:ABC transporter ATP-binding protein [Rikenellaceae bacterium]
MIQINDIEFSYGANRILDHISLKLSEGHIYGLLGENGVGKTTLLTLLCGLKAPQTGIITADGHIPFHREPSFLTDVFYLSDESVALNMTAYDYARTYGKFWTGFDHNKFTEILNCLEVNPSWRMDKMSYGQLKKVYISFALSTNAKYLLMDEPTNGLDIPSKSQFRKSIAKYTSDNDCIVISTHQARDLENIIDPIIILDKQAVLLNASIEEISQRLFFYYGDDLRPNALYREMLPGNNIQVELNTTGEESKVNIEALFNTVHLHKDLIKSLFNK